MKKTVRAAASWAVYQMTIQGQPGPNVVCLLNEWEAIEQATPGLHRLIKAGILNEGEAERLARGKAGDIPVRIPRKKLIAELLDAEPDVIVEADGEPSDEDGQEDAGPLLLPFPSPGKLDDSLGAAGEQPIAPGIWPDEAVSKLARLG